jgi:hypothetical protein
MGMERPVDQCREKNEGAYEINYFHGQSPFKGISFTQKRPVEHSVPGNPCDGGTFSLEGGTFSLERRFAMPKDKEGHGVVLDDKGQEQPADKERAQNASKTEKGNMPPQKVRKDE